MLKIMNKIYTSPSVIQPMFGYIFAVWCIQKTQIDASFIKHMYNAGRFQITSKIARALLSSQFTFSSIEELPNSFP